MNLDQIKQRMEGSLEALRKEFAGLRTGRASTAMLDPVHVDAYGSTHGIQQRARRLSHLGVFQ